jgi:hypothetical protein
MFVLLAGVILCVDELIHILDQNIVNSVLVDGGWWMVDGGTTV